MKSNKENSGMLIAQVLPSLRQGGVERGTIEIAAALQKEGIKNYVVSAGGKMVDELAKIGVEHILLPVQTKNPFKMWLNSYALEKILKEKNVSLVHVRSRAPAWSVKWACARLKIPFVATFHGLYGLSPRLFKKPYNKVMTQGEAVIAVSSFVRQHIIDNYGIDENKVRLIPRGADTEKFSIDKVSQSMIDEMVREHNIPTDKPIISLVGRLSRLKGHFVVLDAVRQMKNQNITVLFVGGNPRGAYEAEVKAALDRLPKSVSLRMFAVPGDKMPILYRLTDICVQPTLVPETFGRGMVEAQAMGDVVVASNHGGACELIENGKTGFLTPVGDSKALAEALDAVLDMSQAQKEKIGADASRHAHTNYSIQKMCDSTISLYREIMKG